MNILKLLLPFLAVCSFAHAETTILVGASHFTAHSDGIWYQEAFPYKLNMNLPSVGIRYDTPLNDSWSIGAGYMHLGRVSSSAEAVALDGSRPNDGGYNSSTKACNGPCWPLSHWYGHGDVQGVLIAPGRHFGPWTVEAGLYLYRPTWQMHIPDWIPCRDCKQQDLTVTHNPKPQVGPMFGIRYQQNDWSLNLTAWHTASEGDEWTSLYHNTTYNASIGYSF